MLLEKTPLTAADLEAQSALELPDRETLVTVVITNILNNLSVDVDVRNNDVAVQVCASINLVNAELLTTDSLKCEIRQ